MRKPTRRIVRESNDMIVYKEIEKMYGVKVAKMLQQYCALKNLDPDTVVNDTSTDRNGMCAWDKFDVWAKGKGVDFADSFGSVDVDDLLGVGKGKKKPRGRMPKVYDRPTDSDIYGEGSGSEPVDEYFISNWIGEELQDCEWVDPAEIQYAGDEPWVEISTPDGDVYRIQVTKVYSSKLGSYLDER